MTSFTKSLMFFEGGWGQMQRVGNEEISSLSLPSTLDLKSLSLVLHPVDLSKKLSCPALSGECFVVWKTC